MFKLDLEKAKEPEIKLPTSIGSLGKAREFQKIIYFCFIDYAKAFGCVDHNKLRKILKEMGILDHLTCLLRNLFRKQQLETDMEQRTDSKLRKKYIKDVYRHSPYLTSVQSISCKIWAGWVTSWNQDCQEKYQQPQIHRWYHSNGRKWRGTKESLEGERREWKSWLKTQHSKN